jgi:hypothetical protein
MEPDDIIAALETIQKTDIAQKKFGREFAP